jgi:hypothetical protein
VTKYKRNLGQNRSLATGFEAGSSWIAIRRVAAMPGNSAALSHRVVKRYCRIVLKWCRACHLWRMKANLELQVRGSDIVYGAVVLLSEIAAELWPTFLKQSYAFLGPVVKFVKFHFCSRALNFIVAFLVVSWFFYYLTMFQVHRLHTVAWL